MNWRTHISISIALQFQFVAGILSSQICFAADGQRANFAQIVLQLPPDRKFSYEWSKPENALILFFPDSSPADLEALNNYDETLVRRMMIKERGANGTEVRFILRDKHVEGLVSVFTDPHRVVLDLFDHNAKEGSDPKTGLPTHWAGELEGGDQNIASPSASGAPSSVTSQVPRRRLLQALAPAASSPNELSQVISSVEAGMGKAWATFPTYIYRIQMATLTDGANKKDDISKLQANALTTSSAMAEYAAKLFDLGHEARAIAAYQQVLQREPEVFERDAAHLWRLAESHLGVGNLTLAEGYYQTLLEKHPIHLLARFAQLRKFDVQAIRTISTGDTDRLNKMAESVLTIPTRGNAELAALITIRNTWWSDPSVDQKSRTALATCSEENENQLQKLLSKIESPKTAFLSSAIIAARMSDPNTNWQNNYAGWLGSFFNRYRKDNDPITASLSASTKNRLTSQFRDLFDADRRSDVVALYEALPKEMKSIAKDPVVSWQIAESYRSLGQADTAINFYEKVATSKSATDRFKSYFWMASISARQLSNAKQQRAVATRISKLKKHADKQDKAMQKAWSQLSPDEKSILITGLGSEFKNITASDTPLRTPAKILLEQYKTALSDNPPKLDAAPGTAKTDWLGNFSPSSGTVRLLDELGRKFAELGMPTERRDAMRLMRFIKPNQLDQDKVAAKIWAAEMIKVAEDHRKADEFLEAGEIYTQVGDAPALVDSRAESLYKGGLLLFRAGKKDDAIKALEKAKSDPNNLFYSNLATERLNQISH